MQFDLDILFKWQNVPLEVEFLERQKYDHGYIIHGNVQL